MSQETVKVTTELKLVKVIKGKQYPIIVKVMDDGTLRFNVSTHPGSDVQLKGLLDSIANEFGTTYEVEKHVHHHHAHTHEHDENLESQGV